MIGLIDMEISILISGLTWIPWKKSGPTASIRNIAILLQLGIWIYDSKVPNMVGRKMRRRRRTRRRGREQTITKRYALQVNAISK